MEEWRVEVIAPPILTPGERGRNNIIIIITRGNLESEVGI
jgi:hypothetical protein